MARASRQEAERHRKEIVAAASRLFRQKGLGRVSVPELMAAAGMTHGGFYGHFASKDALAAEAFAEAFGEMNARLSSLAKPEEGDSEGGIAGLVGGYLSCAHRDHPEAGCAAAGLLEFPRDTDSAEVRSAFLAGVEGMIAMIQSLQGGPAEAGRQEALATLATLVGSLLLSRATRGTPVSEAFLEAAKTALGAGATAKAGD